MKTIFVFFICFFSLCKIQSQNTPIFQRVHSKNSNINFINKITETKEDNVFIYDNFYAGAGVGLGDINNDGLIDIYFCGNQVKDKLYLNKGNFVFEDITKSSGIETIDIGWSSSVTMEDINNDGRLDIFVTKELYDDKPEWRRNKLYINQGNNKFIEVAQAVGLGDTLRTRGAVFFDYDKDNDLDAFLLHQPPNPGMYSKYKPLVKDGDLLTETYAPRLYENRKGQFVDVSKEANILRPCFANAVSVADINNDGYQDIIVANDFEAPDMLYINSGDGTFENIANDAFRHTSFYSMGIDVADINNDSLLDMLIVDMAAEDNFRLKSNMSGMNPKKFWNIVNKGWNHQYMYNVLQMNNGNSTFSDVANFSGVSSTDWSWSPLIADFDNDGFKDIFISNGLMRDIRNTDADAKIKLFIHNKIQDYLKVNGNVDGIEIWDIVSYKELANIYPSSKLQNKLFQNKKNHKFEDVSSFWGIKEKTFSNGAAYADLDNDGDLDLVINNINDEALVYKNNSKNNFIRLSLKSKKNNPIQGAKVYLKEGDNSQFIEIQGVRGMYSTSESIAHFGIGNKNKIDELSIVWPNKRKTVLKNVAANQELIIYLEESKKSKETILSKNKKIFTEVAKGKKIKYKHKENDFDDFEKQVLLPHKLSQFGPSLAVADVNNDGLEDVFVGAAVGFLPKLFIQTRKGEFIPKVNEAFKADILKEDLDALFFDIDNDGDQDLYVVSGGNEYVKGSDNYKDRLYINDGKGNFTKKNNLLDNNPISGSVVVASDFDNDGDLDIFIGGRLTPHKYPVPSDSKLLENVEGNLVDVTNKYAPELNNLGMVTDAIWTDYDNDGDEDLMLTGEWMPLTLFKNNKGKFKKEKIKGLEDSEGWWFSIEEGDFDNDGDMDYIAGNLGLNYKYKTSEKAPFDMYYEDFDGNGTDDIVLGYYNYGKHYPLRGFSCSSQQVPSLKKEIKKYDIFASMEIKDIYDTKKLRKALYYKTKTFASSFVENLGDKGFKVSALPERAQFSNVNDILVRDFNFDGNLDVLLVGNLFVSEIETTRNDAGTGVVLLGDGKNNFKEMSSFESGFFAREDAKKMKIITKGKEKLLIVANNNDWLQVFKF